MDVEEVAKQLAHAMREAIGEVKAQFARELATMAGQVQELSERQTGFATREALEAVASVRAIDGKDGRDGSDGVDGKDGENGRDGVDGKDGENGRDALELLVHGSIDPSKSYARGHYASHAGGLWRSVRKTDNLGDDPRAAGWELLVDGVGAIEFEQVDERNLRMRSVLASGKVRDLPIHLPVPIYRGVYSEDTDYAKDDCATFGGSLWIAQERTQKKPGTGPEWKLAVKKGRDGRDSEK